MTLYSSVFKMAAADIQEELTREEAKRILRRLGKQKVLFQKNV